MWNIILQFILFWQRERLAQTTVGRQRSGQIVMDRVVDPWGLSQPLMDIFEMTGVKYLSALVLCLTDTVSLQENNLQHSLIAVLLWKEIKNKKKT